MGETESDSEEEAYEDRNLLVVAFLRLAAHRGFPVGRGSEKNGYVPVYVELPTGQVSWHVPACMIDNELWSELHLVEWDAHGLEEKRERLRRFAAGPG